MPPRPACRRPAAVQEPSLKVNGQATNVELTVTQHEPVHRKFKVITIPIKVGGVAGGGLLFSNAFQPITRVPSCNQHLVARRRMLRAMPQPNFAEACSAAQAACRGHSAKGTSMPHAC